MRSSNTLEITDVIRLRKTIKRTFFVILFIIIFIIIFSR